jgi:hypothetical protein
MVDPALDRPSKIEQRLMGVAPSQAIRGMDIQALDLAASGRITKSLERRAYKDRAAEAFVDITITGSSIRLSAATCSRNEAN